MRSTPTFNYLAWGAVVAAIIVGCSSPTTEEEPTGDNLPTTPSSAQQGDESDAGDDAPAFQAEFQDGGTDASSTKSDSGSDENLGCIDPNDPGSAETVATELPGTDDCDNSMKTVHGVADGPVDVDVYRLLGTDNGISFSHPIGCSRDTDFELANDNMEMCVFMACQNDKVDAFKSCTAGQYASNSLNMKGCCVTGPGKALPDWDCGGSTQDDSALFYIRLRQVNTAQCLPYKFSYRF